MVDSPIIDQSALPIEKIPLQHFERLAALSQKGSRSEQFDASTCYAYTYVWRYFLGALARFSPELLEASPENALQAGLDAYCKDLAARKGSQRAALVEFRNFASAAIIIVPSCNRDLLRQYKLKLAVLACDEAVGETRLSLALEYAAMSERDERLVAAFMQRMRPGSRALSDPQPPLHEAVAKASSHTASLVYVYRLLLGTVMRHAPDLMSAPNSTRFDIDTMRCFIADMTDPERPAMMLMRLRKLRLALTRICLDFDGASIVDAQAEYRRFLIKAAVIAPSLPVAARLPLSNMPQTLMRHLQRRCASTVKTRRLFEERLKRETSFFAPQQRHQGWWKPALRPATIRGLVDALRAWAGFLKRHYPDKISNGSLTRLTPYLVEEFVIEMRGSCDERSIAALLQQLRLILFRLGRRLADLDWLLHRAKALRAASRPRRIWSSQLRPRQIFKVAMSAFDDARTKLTFLETAANVFCSRRKLAERMRDCLMIALESLMLLRVSNLAGVGWRTTLDRAGDCYKLSFSGNEMKNGRDFRMLVPNHLTAALDHYIHTVRQDLHGQFDDSAMWVSTRTGKALSVEGVTRIMRARLAELLGTAISTHHFRNIGLTAAANCEALDASLPMKLAGHASRQTSERSYITAALNDNRAARLHRESIDAGIEAAMTKLDAYARTAPMLGIVDDISFLPRPKKANIQRPRDTNPGFSSPRARPK